jgi:hypothetical protein
MHYGMIWYDVDAWWHQDGRPEWQSTLTLAMTRDNEGMLRSERWLDPVATAAASVSPTGTYNS